MTDAVDSAADVRAVVFDALLADGRVVQVRPIEPSDAGRLIRFHESLSPETTRFRFFVQHPHLSDKEVARYTTVDHHDREALVALADDEIVGVARFDRYPGTTDAEVAFVVADALQGTGVGSLLLEHLAARGRSEGLEQFIADTLADNRRMLRVFADSGLAPTHTSDYGVTHLVMSLDLSKDAADRIAVREHFSEARSIERLLRPQSIVVVGASARAGSVGHEIVRSLIDGGFCGAVFPVNPKGDEVEGLAGYRTVSDIPESVDLAIVAVGSDKVTSIVHDCAAHGVRGLVVISGGFAEAGADGVQRQRELVAAARSHGMRLIGPNCVGVVNTDPTVRLEATFGAAKAIAGRVALASQSGAVGIAVLEAAARSGIGISSFVSLGNKADVSGNDLLQYWEEDEHTDVVLLYLESFGNPAKFARLARRIGRRKPIIAVKSGRTAAGRRAAGSHTAAMAADDVAVDALLHHCGVMRVDTIDDLLDTALVLAHQPLPQGNRVAVIGNSGGPGVMAADASASAGLELAVLAADTGDGMRRYVAASASVANPVDLLGDAGPTVYSDAVTAVLADPNVDAVIVVHAPTLVADPEAIAAAIASVATDKPIVAVLVGRDRGLLSGPERPVPVFASVESAVAALGHVVTYARWRARPVEDEPARADVALDAARVVAEGALASSPDGRWLEPSEVAALLTAYGLPLISTEIACSRAEATRAAQRVGFPVALKAHGPELVHKTDVGGVVLGLRSAAAVERAWTEMKHRLGPAMTGAVVQPMANPGVELIAGIARDDTFGPLVLFGMGGTLAELIGDRAVRVAPITDTEANEVVHSLRCSPLLTGYRGSEPVDTAGLADLLVRLGLLARDVPEVAELDLNPVIATAAASRWSTRGVRWLRTAEPSGPHRHASSGSASPSADPSVLPPAGPPGTQPPPRRRSICRRRVASPRPTFFTPWARPTWVLRRRKRLSDEAGSGPTSCPSDG